MLGFVVLTYLVIVGASNAVNLTDGLDGLAIMPVILVAASLGIFAYVTGSSTLRQVPAPAAHSGHGRAAGVLRGHGRRGAGLFVVQRPPGANFYGRRGGAGPGRCLATIAVIVRQEIVLAIMGGIFVVEALSVMLQVA